MCTSMPSCATPRATRCPSRRAIRSIRSTSSTASPFRNWWRNPPWACFAATTRAELKSTSGPTIRTASRPSAQMRCDLPLLRLQASRRRICAEGRDAVRIVGPDVLFNSALVVAAKQAHGGFLHQFRKGDAVDEVERIERIALRLGHLVALGVAHDGIDVHMPKRHFAGEMLRHHDHPGDPEENDVEACHQHRGREKGVEVFGLFGPAKRSEGHQRRRKPSVEYVIVALERTAISFRGSPFFSLGFVAADIDIALVVIPRRDLMTPPQLARDAPILDLFQPLPVPSGPILRKELDVPLCHPFE